MPRSAAPYRCGIGSAMSLPLHSATDHEAGDAAPKAGEPFARALAAKDSATLRSLIADTVDFQALTPGRHWRPPTATAAGEQIMPSNWFWTVADIQRLESGSPSPLA